MSSSVKVPYQRLRQESGYNLDDIDECQLREYYEKTLARSRTWYRFRKVPIRRRFKLKIPSIRRLLRRKTKLVSSIRVSFASVVKRLKESQSHLGELFAGNYLFLQVNPSTPFKCHNKASHDLKYGLSSGRYYLPKIAN